MKCCVTSTGRSKACHGEELPRHKLTTVLGQCLSAARDMVKAGVPCQATSPEPCSRAALPQHCHPATQMVQSHNNYPPKTLHLSLCLVFYPSFKLALVSRTKIQFKSYFWSRSLNSQFLRGVVVGLL